LNNFLLISSKLVSKFLTPSRASLSTYIIPARFFKLFLVVGDAFSISLSGDFLKVVFFLKRLNYKFLYEPLEDDREFSIKFF
jgi:hypothetical protein